MTTPMLDQIVNAVLYEGHILYPYRPSSKKIGRARCTFGHVYPKAYSDAKRGGEPFLNQTECLLQTDHTAPTLEVKVRFLHPQWREVGFLSSPDHEITGGAEAFFRVVPELSVGGVLYQTWREATEREVTVTLGPLEGADSKRSISEFSFPASRTFEPFPSEPGVARAAMVRRQDSLVGVVKVETTPITANVFKITVRVSNRTPADAAQCDDLEAVIMRTFASTHTILHAPGGEFISLLDPPDEFTQAAAECKNIGTWPVLVGNDRPAECDTMLSSPVVLYDYPRVAPEFLGDFFTEIQMAEILTLPVLAVTNSEKPEMRHVDEYTRRISERVEMSGTKELLRRHDAMRKFENVQEASL